MILTEEARAFLDAHRVGHLATADASGAPHVVPLCYARVGDSIYFVCDEKPKRAGPRALKRLSNIAHNPRVALVIDDYDEEWSRLAFLLLRLQAEIVRDEDEYQRALGALRGRYPQYRAMSLKMSANPIVRLIPNRFHLWRASSTPRYEQRKRG
jgi:PPOX class probable F420-dependent enzyme